MRVTKIGINLLFRTIKVRVIPFSSTGKFCDFSKDREDYETFVHFFSFSVPHSKQIDF